MFVITKEDNEKVSKVIRFPKYLIEQIKKEIRKNNISFTKIVIEACIYALDNMDK